MPCPNVDRCVDEVYANIRSKSILDIAGTDSSNLGIETIQESLAYQDIRIWESWHDRIFRSFSSLRRSMTLPTTYGDGTTPKETASHRVHGNKAIYLITSKRLKRFPCLDELRGREIALNPNPANRS